MSPGQKNNEPTVGLQDMARRAAVIARNAHLRSINLRRLEVTLVSEPSDDGVLATVHSEHGQEHEFHRVQDQAHIDVRVHFNVSVKAEDQLLLTLKATFNVSYDLNQGMPDEAVADIPAFASTNTMVHVWPYYRELVQSTTWRMGIPPFPLPLFRVLDPSKKTEPSNAANSQ